MVAMRDAILLEEWTALMADVTARLVPFKRRGVPFRRAWSTVMRVAGDGWLQDPGAGYAVRVIHEAYDDVPHGAYLFERPTRDEDDEWFALKEAAT